MALVWKGDELKRKMARSSALAINATMAACVQHARANHRLGAHALKRYESHSGEAERSVKITKPARSSTGGTSGMWGSKGIVYFRRLELGFQGKDRAGREVNAPAYPSLRPAADEEYPKLASRIRRALHA